MRGLYWSGAGQRAGVVGRDLPGASKAPNCSFNKDVAEARQAVIIPLFQAW